MSALVPALALSSLPWLAAAGLTALSLPLAKRNRGARLSTWVATNHNPSMGQGPVYCRLCGGGGRVPCTVCNTTGSLARGGFTPKNTVRIGNVVGTQWTSVHGIGSPVPKWRHFLCVGKKGKNVRDAVVVLSSTCGPVAGRIRVEVPLKELKSREVWEGGWTTLNDIHASGGLPGTACSACRGETTVICPRCDGLGQVGLI